jgi:hypothetical protein
VAVLHGDTSIVGIAPVEFTAQPFEVTTQDNDPLVGLLKAKT